MSTPKVSIIVPIYNVEKYINKCVDSLINQTLKEIEIILVDDGSKDSSGLIADSYAEKDKRITVIHQCNAGLGPARNSGMKVASGEYIGFVDSDDWVKPDMFLNLYKAAVRDQADIVAGGHCDYTNGIVTKTKVHPLGGQVIKGREKIFEVRKNLFGHNVDDHIVDAFPMSMWIAIYRRELIKKNNLQFKNILSEDTIFNIPAYACADVISFISDTDYCYRKDEQPSITRSFSESKLSKYEEFLEQLRDLAAQENNEECEIRAKRTAIDYSRLYVGLVEKSNLKFSDKKKQVKRYVKSEIIKKCWKDYPIDLLPIQQRIFQHCLLKGWYGIPLILDKLRQKAKKRGWQ